MRLVAWIKGEGGREKEEGGSSGGSTMGSGGHRPPNLAQAPQIFGHSSSTILVELIGSIVNFA